LINKEDIIRFHQLPFKNKISIGIKNFPVKNHIKIDEHERNICVPDGVKLYNITFKYFDAVEWINKGIIKKTVFSRIKSFFLKKDCRCE
jgi:uncharacterized protein (DUF1919 family)